MSKHQDERKVVSVYDSGEIISYFEEFKESPESWIPEVTALDKMDSSLVSVMNIYTLVGAESSKDSSDAPDLIDSNESDQEEMGSSSSPTYSDQEVGEILKKIDMRKEKETVKKVISYQAQNLLQETGFAAKGNGYRTLDKRTAPQEMNSTMRVCQAVMKSMKADSSNLHKQGNRVKSIVEELL